MEKAVDVFPQPEGAKRLSVCRERLEEKPGSGDPDGDGRRQEESSSRRAIHPATSETMADREESRRKGRDGSLRQHAEAERRSGETRGP